MIKHDFFFFLHHFTRNVFHFVVRMTYSGIRLLRNIFSSLHTALGFDQNTCPQIIFWGVPITILVRPIRLRFANVIIVHLLYHRYMYLCVRCYMCNYMNYLPNDIYVRLCAKNFLEEFFFFVY